MKPHSLIHRAVIGMDVLYMPCIIKNRVDSHFKAMVFDVRCSNKCHPEVERK
jgi:hypothetical protein